MNALSTSTQEIASEPIVLRHDVEGIATVTLNRPQQRNALSEAMLLALGETLSAIGADKSVRVVLLAANGPVFSSGHDLKELTAHRTDPDQGRAFFAHIMTTCSGVMQQIVQLRQPVITVIHGMASAAGCQLVASCDLAVASSAAQFCTPGVNIGLFCSTPMDFLHRKPTVYHFRK